MSTEITRIREKARREKDVVFTTLFHHISDVDNLRESFHALQGRKAVGVDGVSKEAYAEGLEENLIELSDKLKRGGYRPQPKRRSYIPKAGSKKGRPLGISSFEDKLVECSVKRTLEGIYEEAFEDSSYGYRPGRSQHQCLDRLGRSIQQKKVSYVVEADIRGFFDKVNHEWLMKFLEHRVGDRRVLRLIKRMLNAGVMEDGLVTASEEGTPQGSVLSPLLSNIYLHYVLDLWFSRRMQKSFRGEGYYFRYADDFLACFQYREDANRFYELLRERLEGFSLSLAEEKSGCIEFGRFAQDTAKKQGRKAEMFTFLGFAHYCGKTQKGHFKVKRRSSRKKLQHGLREFESWVKKARCWMPTGALLKSAKSRVIGHVNYYGITDNSDQVWSYLYQVRRILFKWLNRRSQRKSYNWSGYDQMLQSIDWPVRTVRVDLNPYRRGDDL